MLVLKYVVPQYPFPTLYFGIANVLANGLIMLRFVAISPVSLISLLIHHSSSVVLWISQNMEDDYTYNLAL